MFDAECTQNRNWIFDGKSSILQSSMLTQREINIGIDLIFNINLNLCYHNVIGATASVYFRRFFLKAKEKMDIRIIAITCHYLACKVEEIGQIRCDISIHGYLVFLEKVKKRTGFQAGSILNELSEESPVMKATCITTKEEILKHEILLLKLLNGDITVYHPYIFLEDYENNTDMISIINDSYKTNAIFMFPPFIIAYSAMLLYFFLSERDIEKRKLLEKLKDSLNLYSITNCCEVLLEHY